MTPEITSKHIITMMNKEVRERTVTIVTISPSVKLFQINSILLTRLILMSVPVGRSFRCQVCRELGSKWAYGVDKKLKQPPPC